MKYTIQPKKIGDSFYLLIPNHIRKSLRMIGNETLEVDINLVNTEEIKKHYQCKCGKDFEVEVKDSIYCPDCGFEDIESEWKEFKEDEEVKDDK